MILATTRENNESAISQYTNENITAKVDKIVVISDRTKYKTSIRIYAALTTRFFDCTMLQGLKTSSVRLHFSVCGKDVRVKPNSNRNVSE